MSVHEADFPVAASNWELRRFGIDDVRVVRALKSEGAASHGELGLVDASARLSRVLRTRVRIGLERRSLHEGQVMAFIAKNRGVL